VSIRDAHAIYRGLTHMRLRSNVLLFVLLTSCLVAACGRSATADRPKRARPLVGVSLLTQTHEFYKDLENAMRTEAAARQLDLAVVSCEMDPVKQASQLDDFISQQVTLELSRVAVDGRLPVAFGVITCNTLEQAVARSSAGSGNKGWEAALAAIEMANLWRALRSGGN